MAGETVTGDGARPEGPRPSPGARPDRRGPLDRDDAVLLVIPLALGLAVLAAGVSPVSLEQAVGTGSAIAALAIGDALVRFDAE